MFAEGRVSISVNDILNKVSEESIITYYLGLQKIPCVINSPLRTDLRPSFSIYKKNGRIKYLDFATGESGSIYDLLSSYWGLTFSDTLLKIYRDIQLIPKIPKVSNIVSNNNERVVQEKKSKRTLNCKIRDWREHDILYWKQYGISLPWLKFSNTYPISRIIIETPYEVQDIPADKYAYVYVEHKDNKCSLKIYQPYSKEHKWSNSHNKSVWDLWSQLPATGDNLIITSSRKDALTIWENTEIPSCSLQAESYLPKNSVVEDLKKRFKNIYVLYDNDYTKKINYGRVFGEKLADKFNLKNIYIPEKYQSKDPSDLVLNHGVETLKKVINNLIKI